MTKIKWLSKEDLKEVFNIPPKNKDYINCLNCGKRKYVRNALINVRKYCDNKCKNEHKGYE